jgi:hypothetical protein
MSPPTISRCYLCSIGEARNNSEASSSLFFRDMLFMLCADLKVSCSNVTVDKILFTKMNVFYECVVR